MHAPGVLSAKSCVIVHESVVDICLNLKQLKFRKFSKDSETITLEAKGAKGLKAKDLKVSSDIEILDPETRAFEITIEEDAAYFLDLDSGLVRRYDP